MLRKHLPMLGIVLLAGCASTATVVQTLDAPTEAGRETQRYSIQDIKSHTREAPQHFLVAVKSYLEQELTKRNLLADSGAPRKVEIIITDYRMRSGFTRQMFGIFAGKDGVVSKVQVFDTSSGKVIGASEVDSYNLMAIGEQEDIARMHAEEIAEFLAGEKKG